jgi:hypothetical protein
MNINYFIGKVCTIITTPINRDYKQENPNTYPEQLYNYFLGRVLEIDKDGGVWLEQVMTPEKSKSYFYGRQVIGIAEEQVLNPQHPDHAKIIEQIKSANKSIEELTKPTGPFVDVNAVGNISKKLAEKYDN